VISWRYHIVSLVAVVLAFGLGILAGTSVIDEGLVDQIQRNYAEAIQQRDAAIAEVASSERFIQALQPILRNDVLLGEEAIVLTMGGVDGPAQRTVQELEAAGVEVLAMLELTPNLAETEVEDNAAMLETILGLPGADPQDLRAAVAERLADRLAGDVEGEDDVLGQLLEEGLVTADRDLDPERLLGIGGEEQLVVIAVGGTAPGGLPGPEALLVPLTEGLVRLDVATTAVGTTEDAYGFVGAVRGAPGIQDCSMVTVDDIDLEVIGGIAMVMGIDRFLADDDPAFRPGGDYGIEGDAMIVPGADEPPQSCRV
jgi:hypothetical protein